MLFADNRLLLTLIVSSPGCSESLALKKLDLIFSALVLYTGLDCITNADHEDKFAHDVKVDDACTTIV
jgi:hypothetical protein